MRCWTAGFMALALLISEGCLETEGSEPPAAEELVSEALEGRVEPEAADEAVCEALASRRASCHGGFVAVDGCASRFACSRQLWRPEVVEEVYDCVETQPCDVVDPAMACLTEIGAELEPSDAQLHAEEALGSLEGRCEGLLEVAPGQTDDVYEVIGSCIEAEPSCEGIGTCVVLSLDALVDDVCRSVETI